MLKAESRVLALGPVPVEEPGLLLGVPADFFFQVEHLSDPISALASICRLARETVVLVCPLIHSEERIARFEGSADHPEKRLHVVDVFEWSLS